MKITIFYLSRWNEYSNKYGKETFMKSIMIFNKDQLNNLPFDKSFYLKMCENTADKESWNEDDIYGLLEDTFHTFNSEQNPLNNKQDYIRMNDSHTSMSVGDLILLDNRLFIVASLGFIEITDPNVISKFTCSK